VDIINEAKLGEFIELLVKEKMQEQLQTINQITREHSLLKLQMKKNELHNNLANKALSDLVAFLSGRKTESRLSISTIIPTKNRVELLLSALKSCAWQTRLPNEVIVINDGAQFSTSELKSFESIFDGKCELIIITNKYSSGAAGGRKTGMEYSSSDVLTYLDDDNLMWPTWLETVDREFQIGSDQLIYGAQFRKEWNSAILAEEKFSHKKLCEKNYIDTGAIAHDRNVGIWDTELNTLADDWNFVLSIASRENPSLRFVGEIASVYFTDAAERLSRFGFLNREGLKEKYREYYEKNA
jgi:glycosyltransferase involved in cell wall biosynthesis